MMDFGIQTGQNIGNGIRRQERYFFVLREHGPDVIFRLDNNYLEVVKGFLTPEEQEFIKDNINYYE